MAPDPSPTAMPTMAASPAPSASPSATPTPTMTMAPSPTPSGSARPTARPTPTASAVPGKPRVTVRFESTPPGAIVELESGEQMGVTPVSKEFVKGSEMLRVTFRLAGHEPKSELFTLGQDRSVKAELKKSEPAHVPATPKPSPTVDVKPSPTAKPTPSPSKSAIDERVEDLK